MNETRFVKEEDGKWFVWSEDGTKKIAGPYDTKEEADKRLGQIEYFKHQGGRSAERTAEVRHVGLAVAELRADTADGKRLIIGTAVPYNTLSIDLGGFREQFAPGAFTEALKEADVRALVDHNPSLIVGRTKAGTLKLRDTPEALTVEIDVAPCDYGDALLVSVQRRDKDGMSFRFYCLEDSWEIQKDGTSIRTVAKADIDDVSVVTYPAYLDTTAAVRSLDHFRRGQARRGKALHRELRRLRLAEAE